MNKARLWWLPGLAAVVTALMPTAPAGAETNKERCVNANADAQALRQDNKLTAAREQLALCVDPACPAIVREDCAKRLDDLERAQPTIVFDVKDSSGSDMSAVTVTVDGKPLAERLVGTALKVDPGEHVFLFTVVGRAPSAAGSSSRRARRTAASASCSGAPPARPRAPRSGRTPARATARCPRRR